MYKKPSNYKNINTSQSKKKTEKKQQKKQAKQTEISEAMMKKLKEHSKLHKNGMKSAHMKNNRI